MKILYDHQIFLSQKFGGISRYYNEIMKIKSDSYDVITLDPNDFINEIAKNDFVSKGKRFLMRKFGVKNEQTGLTFLSTNVLQTLRETNYDIFHPTYYDPYFLNFNKKPFVLTVYDMIHEIYKEQFPDSDLTSHHKLLLCNAASQIITISEKTKDDLISIFNIPAEKVNSISLASNFDEIKPIKPGNLLSVGKYILFVGNRGLYKNFYFPVFALTELLKNDKELKMLCTGYPFSKEELQFFHDRGLQSQIVHIYLNNDNELAWVYANAALFIFPSLYEGFGFPLLEAFACNCPVISSNGGSLPEVGGDAALYFDPKNLLQIQETAHSVLYNSTVRDELIARGKERYKCYSWDTCRQKTKEVYNLIHN